MKLRFRGRKHITPDQLSNLESITHFIIKKFFNINRRKKLVITVNLRDDLFEKTKQYGTCIWEDTHFRPDEFTIELDTKQSIGLMLNTLAHELVHVKQWAKGEMYELQRTAMYKFNGRTFDSDKMDYWDYPWEIEAHGRAIGLVVQWVRANKLNADDYIPKEV